ncbi:MAG: cytochrome b N-terminal domain-containing protein [Armatimonadetes bacterium]|nr:cytochrome b N-terminal domain-containing protein [Armatimonadota bacterium]
MPDPDVTEQEKTEAQEVQSDESPNGDADYDAAKEFTKNLRTVGRSFMRSWIRQGKPDTERDRSQTVFQNLWLHVHPARIDVRSIKFNTTMAMGIVTFSLFIILTITGLLLMVYYKPAIDQAYDSMKDIHYVVPTGRFIRNIHKWAAELMVITVFLHMCRVFYTACYKAPRQYNWLMGMGLFVLTLALSFTGYLLPWDQLSYWAITIGANIARSPIELTDAIGITQSFDPGGFQRQLLLGSDEVGADALIRFNLLHVILLPLVMAGLMGVHFWRIRKDGGLGKPGGTPTQAGKGAPVPETPAATPKEEPTKSYGLMAIVRDKSSPANQDPVDTVASWPHLLRAELAVFMATVLICVVLALAFDAPLKELANPAVPENPAKAPWYFLGLQEMVSYSAFMGGMLIPGIVIVGLSLIPYLDREKEDAGVYLGMRGSRKIAWWSLVFGFVSSVLAVAIPIQYGWLRDWFPDINQLWIIFINPGSILTLMFVAWSIWVLKRFNSTRLSAVALFTCFLIGFIVLTYVGSEMRGPNWDFYWIKSSWPIE